MRFVLGCGLAVAMALPAAADDKKDAPVDAKKLIGKWEAKDLPGDRTMTIEFAKDGKVMATFASGGKTETKQGTYKLAGAKLTVSPKGEDKDHVATILKLTNTEMEIKGEDGGPVMIFKRVKAK